MSSTKGGTSAGGGLGQLEEVTQEGNTTRLVVKRQNGGPNLVIQITNEGSKSTGGGGINKEANAQATNVLSQLLKAVTASDDDNVEDKIKVANKIDAAAAEEKKARAKELREQNMTPLMKAAKAKDGNLVRKEIIQIKKRNNRENGGDVGTLEAFLNEAEKEDKGLLNNGNGGGKSKPGSGNQGKEKSGSAGWAAVHFACDVANYDGLRYLLDAGANPNLTERMGATPCKSGFISPLVLYICI
jgi:hypothetical protein